MAQMVMTDAAEGAPAHGSLFAGKSFFLVQRVPSRNHYISQIQANGGRVVKLEAQADYMIADHIRRDTPVGSISYTFIESSLREGELADPANHVAGPPPGSTRAVGSGVPGKATRTPFTPEDDEYLWEYVMAAQRRGGMVKGNQIYQQLELLNNRHTFQAWRDRYLKKMHGQRAPTNLMPSTHAQPTPRPAPVSRPAPQAVMQEPEPEPDFTQEDFDALLLQADDINNIPEDRLEDAWQAWESMHPEHTSEEWAAYWEQSVKPEYFRKMGLRNGDRGDARDDPRDESEEEEEEPEPTPSKGKRKRDNGDDPSARSAPASRQAIRDEDAMPTSEANAAVQAQLRAEEDAYSHETAGQQQPKVAEAREYLEEQDVEGQQVDVALLPAHDSEQLADQGNGIQVPASSVQESQGEGQQIGQALTEENLASQQAQHRVHLQRGNDLPEDDDNHDQTGYLEYLQDTMQEAQRNNKDEPTSGKAKQNGQTVQATHGADSEHMFSSQANVDAVDLRWPSLSPQAQRDQTQQFDSQNISFESQVDYPNLPVLYPKVSNSIGKHPADGSASRLKQASRGNGDNHWINQQERSMRDDETDAPGEEDDAGGFDLSVPEPEGGFDLSSPMASQGAAVEATGNTQEQEERNARRSTEADPQTLDTQAIVNAETQQPDFDMPLPDIDFEASQTQPSQLQPQSYERLKSPAPSSPTPQGSARKSRNPPLYAVAAAAALAAPRRRRSAPPPKPSESQTLADDDITPYISHMVSRGYEERDIFNALQRTSMRPELAEEVLWRQRRGEGGEMQLAGIWNDEEDGLIEGGDARGMRMLEPKHGWNEMLARLEFLKAWREA